MTNSRGIEHLELGAEEFWSARSFDDLARQQGAGAHVDPALLYDGDASDAERDAFMAAIAD